MVVEHLHCTRRQLGSEDFCTVRPVKEGSRGLYADQPSAAYDQEALKKMKENSSMEAIIARWGKWLPALCCTSRSTAELIP